MNGQFTSGLTTGHTPIHLTSFTFITVHFIKWTEASAHLILLSKTDNSSSNEKDVFLNNHKLGNGWLRYCPTNQAIRSDSDL